MRSIWICAGLVLLSAPLARSQDAAATVEPQQETQRKKPERFEELKLRVLSLGQSRELNIDRGRRDGIKRGDRVQLKPRDGRVLWAVVLRVDQRSAVLELRTPGDLPPVGTRGIVRLPASRFDKPKHAPKPQPENSVGSDKLLIAEKPAPAAPERDPWADIGKDWTPDMPLLAGVGVLRPAERPRSYTGRVYSINDWIVGSSGDRSDSFQRLGMDLSVGNPFGLGGELRYDGEYNLRSSENPDDTNQDDDFSDLRLDRLSYAIGGTRFDGDRYEFGRFLQYGVPEFGVLDGAEWTSRRSDGTRFGLSAGNMPEPRANGENAEDRQVSAWYGWVADETEVTSVSGGYQKTFNDGDSDRELFLLKGHHLPVKGWNYQGSLWMDSYSADERFKDEGFELTRAYLTAGHRWAGGEGLDLAYTRQRYPDLLRQESLAVNPLEVAEHHDERLSASGWAKIRGGRRVHARLGIWSDQDDSGGDADLGVDIPGLVVNGSLTRVTIFSTDGKFSSALGLRLGFGRGLGNGRWDAYYEISKRRQLGFLNEANDSVQHRLHGTRTFFSIGGTSVAAYGTLLLQDIENTYSAGLSMQWSF